MKRILVPTDFSDPSFFAIASAASLTSKVDAQLIILHVLDKPEDPDQRSKHLQRIFQMPELQGVTHHYKLVMGDPIDTILKEQADIIVMGSKGAKGIKSFFVGTNAEHVAKQADCPVFIVKKKTDLSKMKSIVFPTGMKREDEDVIPEVKALQEMYGAKLHILKAYDDSLVLQRDVEKRLKDYAEFHAFKDYSVSARSGIDESDVIMDFAEEINADMIALVTHDRQGLARLMGGYISGDVINNNERTLWAKSLDT